MERPRAADDFEVIRERLEELRRQREEISSTDSPDKPPSGEDGDEDAERNRQAQCDGAPPGWVPTIFLPQPTD